jgi:DNA-directed RNA polymerase alpha subunit
MKMLSKLAVNSSLISVKFSNVRSKKSRQTSRRKAYTPIEIMGLSPRTLNALVNGDILSIEQLTKCTEAKLSSIKGFGKKAMTEVRDALEVVDSSSLETTNTINSN